MPYLICRCHLKRVAAPFHVAPFCVAGCLLPVACQRRQFHHQLKPNPSSEPLQHLRSVNRRPSHVYLICALCFCAAFAFAFGFFLLCFCFRWPYLALTLAMWLFLLLFVSFIFGSRSRHRLYVWVYAFISWPFFPLVVFVFLLCCDDLDSYSQLNVWCVREQGPVMNLISMILHQSCQGCADKGISVNG